jgi:ATP-dependent Lon protease
MKESAEAALSYVKSHYGGELAEEHFFERYDIHLHIPEGAVPKDGPSAGIAIAVALASIALGRKVRNDIAMTGEVTLTGKILPVGGVKEKVIAAHRAGIRTVILPAHNRKDLEEIPSIIKKDLQFHFIGRINEGLNHALVGERGSSRRKRKRAYAGV